MLSAPAERTKGCLLYTSGGVLIYSDSDDCSIGDILIYHGEITLWKRASNEGAFDAKAYYFARGFDFAMEGPALDRKVCAKRQTAEALWQLGQQIKERCV